MIDPPEVTKTDRRLTAAIHLTIPRSEIQNAMGPGITEVMATVGQQGLTPSGAWFSRHFRMEPETFDFEVGVPVDRAVEPAGRVLPSELPAATVIRTVYHGPYEGLGAAWGEFESWIAANGYETGAELWESYLTGPESGDDASQYRTELSRPLADA